MIKKVLLLMFLLPAVAFAHPSDAPCVVDENGNLVLENGAPINSLDGNHPVCQDPAPHLGLDDPNMMTCHRRYWHFRRQLVATIGLYNNCVGRVRELINIYNQAHGQAQVCDIDTHEFNPACPVGDVGVKNYWDIVPAHVIVDKPGDLAHCEAQVEAAQHGIMLDQVHIALCEFSVQYYRYLLGINPTQVQPPIVLEDN